MSMEKEKIEEEWEEKEEKMKEEVYRGKKGRNRWRKRRTQG